MSKKYGFTLLELMITLAIFGILLSAIFGSISTSRTNWQNAGNQIDRQQNARKAADRVAWELRLTSPSWTVDAVSYNVSINGDGDWIDFYVPVFDNDNEITQLNAVRYNAGGLNNAQLLRREGSDTLVVANDIDNVIDQKPFFAFSNVDNTIIDISIPVIKNGTTFVLTSQANLRNRQTQLDAGVIIEEIIE